MKKIIVLLLLFPFILTGQNGNHKHFVINGDFINSNKCKNLVFNGVFKVPVKVRATSLVRNNLYFQFPSSLPDFFLKFEFTNPRTSESYSEILGPITDFSQVEPSIFESKTIEFDLTQFLGDFFSLKNENCYDDQDMFSFPMTFLLVQFDLNLLKYVPVNLANHCGPGGVFDQNILEGLNPENPKVLMFGNICCGLSPSLYNPNMISPKISTVGNNYLAKNFDEEVRNENLSIETPLYFSVCDIYSGVFEKFSNKEDALNWINRSNKIYFLITYYKSRIIKECILPKFF
ncbi:MAG: hypothetical protein R2879_00635 [Saprospiraceae bacterium]